jgi:hypothetical protein
MERENERCTDYQKLLDEKVRSNEIKVYNLASAREPSCPQHDFYVSDEQAEALIKSGAREFGNFAYTDYGSLGDALYGAGDYMLTEYFRQYYPEGKDEYGRQCVSTAAVGFSGADTVLTGKALEEFKSWPDPIAQLSDFIQYRQEPKAREEWIDSFCKNYDLDKDMVSEGLDGILCDFARYGSSGKVDVNEDKVISEYQERFQTDLKSQKKTGEAALETLEDSCKNGLSHGYMHTSDYYAEEAIIRSQSVEELRKAVIAHGGEYVFPEEDRPVVAGYSQDGQSMDWRIDKVRVDPEGFLHATGYDRQAGQSDDLDLYDGDVSATHIQYITGNITATDKVKDVSIQNLESYRKYGHSFSEAAVIMNSAGKFSIAADIDGQEMGIKPVTEVEAYSVLCHYKAAGQKQSLNTLVSHAYAPEILDMDLAAFQNSRHKEMEHAAIIKHRDGSYAVRAEILGHSYTKTLGSDDMDRLLHIPKERRQDLARLLAVRDLSPMADLSQSQSRSLRR